MSKRAILAATAIVVGSFNPVFSAQALAAVTILDPLPDAQGPSAGTLAAMEVQCDTLAAAHGANWDGALDESSIVATLVAGPTEVGTHSIADAIDGTLEGAGTFTPAHLEILGDPYRNGGSVNMFGIQQSVGGHYSASTYDFEGEFETTFSFAFDCNMTETVQVLVQGYYEVAGDFGESEDAIRAQCEAWTAMGDDEVRPPWWGEDHGGAPGAPHCRFVTTSPAGEEEEPRPDEAGTPIEETQTDTLLAHEDAGEGFDTDETLLIGQVVVCISPSKTGTKLPGSWLNHNGYTGDKCTRAWYDGGAKVGVPNLNDGSHNWVTVPVV